MESVVFLVWFDHDLEVGGGGKNVRVSQRHEPDLVQSVRGVGDQLSQEDLKWGYFSNL